MLYCNYLCVKENCRVSEEYFPLPFSLWRNWPAQYLKEACAADNLFWNKTSQNKCTNLMRDVTPTNILPLFFKLIKIPLTHLPLRFEYLGCTFFDRLFKSLPPFEQCSKTAIYGCLGRASLMFEHLNIHKEDSLHWMEQYLRSWQCAYTSFLFILGDTKKKFFLGIFPKSGLGVWYS